MGRPIRVVSFGECMLELQGQAFGEMPTPMVSSQTAGFLGLQAAPQCQSLPKSWSLGQPLSTSVRTASTVHAILGSAARRLFTLALGWGALVPLEHML